MTEELKTRTKLKLRNIAKEWLITEHREGNIQSLVNLILSFTEPRDKQITELEAQIDKMKCCANCRKYYRGETADDKGYLCVHHDFNDKCKLWELEEN